MENKNLAIQRIDWICRHRIRGFNLNATLQICKNTLYSFAKINVRMNNDDWGSTMHDAPVIVKSNFLRIQKV
jgi:hypothetical protein